MNDYRFTLRYRLPGEDYSEELLLERLAAANCDDALVGFGQKGRLALEFTREAESAEDAVQRARASVEGALPFATYIEMVRSP